MPGAVHRAPSTASPEHQHSIRETAPLRANPGVGCVKTPQRKRRAKKPPEGALWDPSSRADTGLQGVPAPGLRRRHQAVQQAVAQVGVASSQVVGQVLHVHLLQLLLQQPVQHRVRHRLQAGPGRIQAAARTGPHGQIALVRYGDGLAARPRVGRPLRLAAAVFGGGGVEGVLGDGGHLHIWILLQEAAVVQANAVVRVQGEDRLTARDQEARGTVRRRGQSLALGGVGFLPVWT
ncbi:hypothetical protein EYF80_050800 [Liparis tanakae]|uniref:Uncharacterized protein n=1 Tax=Liparis tanakae TaxID=230148 RepID=A0A4Z2FDR6_9TELE|nr:hypothetical protein EYF80_050800 [Liparis tanakae]